MRLFQVAGVVLLVVIAATSANAQGVGIKGGVVFPDFSAEAIDFDNRVGTELGVFFGGNRSGIVGVQGEVNWLRKEAKVPPVSFRIDYIQAAGLLRLNAGTNSTSGFALYGLVGP